MKKQTHGMMKNGMRPSLTHEARKKNSEKVKIATPHAKEETKNEKCG